MYNVFSFEVFTLVYGEVPLYTVEWWCEVVCEVMWSGGVRWEVWSEVVWSGGVEWGGVEWGEVVWSGVE